ncbi:MAG TPA: efflux transporter outer membrane subunit [Candidatus Krumholzibacteria bacterium]
MKSLRLAAALVCVGLFAACSFAPKYHRPELPVPQQFADTTVSTDKVQSDWWTLFGDATLDSLVGEALRNNQDLAAAAARVEQARALAGVAKAALYPEINVQGSGSRTQLPDNTAVGRDNPANFFSLLGTISYELDFWGKLRNANKAARNQMLSTEEGRRNVELALISDVIATYFDLLSLDRQLAISRSTVESRKESVRLQTLRYEAGSISQLDLSQAQAELAATEAAVPVFERNMRQTENRMSILLGRFGGSVARGEDGKQLDAIRSPEIPVGLPSELIARRPDVLAAEYAMIGANANIGAARAAYLPSIGLTGYGGWESTDLSQLITKNTDVWQASVGVFQTIFAPGRTQRQVDLAWGLYRETLAGYIRSVQQGFADVEDALIARRSNVLIREAEDREVAARLSAQDLSQIRYDAGESSYIEVLDAQRQLFQAQILQAQSRSNELSAFVQLFKALGGGWQTDEQIKARYRMAGEAPEETRPGTTKSQ